MITLRYLGFQNLSVETIFNIQPGVHVVQQCLSGRYIAKYPHKCLDSGFPSRSLALNAIIKVTQFTSQLFTVYIDAS